MSQVERRRRPGRLKNWNVELVTVVEGPSSLEERIEAGQDRRPVVAPRKYVCMYVFNLILFTNYIGNNI